jgi:transposase-like protein
MYSSKVGSRRRRRTTKQRQRLVARFQKSQMTQRDFAARHGIGLSTLGKWLRLESTAPSPPVKFTEVVLPNTSLRYPVEVISPQGWVVRLQNGSELHTLSEVLQALPC